MNKLVLLIVLGLLCVTPVHAAVVLNELYPKFADPAWQYVELYNTGSETVFLDHWKLDHTAGDAKAYILNASANIASHGFLVLFGSQTAIQFSTEGDTVRLFDAGGALIDSQGYLGTLGFNTALGRSPDGGNGWVVCSPEPYTATPNAANNCPPAPTATPIPPPTSTPTPSPTRTPTPTPFTPQTFGALVTTPPILGATTIITPLPTPASATTNTDILQLSINKIQVAYFLMGIATLGICVMGILWVRRVITSRRAQ